MSEPRIPTSPRVALEPREETTCSRCGTRCLDYRSPGPVCIGCVDEDRRAAEAQVARLRGAVELKHAALERLAAIHEAEYDSELRYSRPAWLTAALSPAPEGERSIDECPICGRWMPAFGGEVFDGTTETCSGCKAEVTASVVDGQLVTEAAPSPWDPRASRKEVSRENP